MKSVIISAGLATATIFLANTPAFATDTMEGWKDKLRGKIQSSYTYPAKAIENGIEGTVKVRFRFARNGGVDGVEIVESSGYDILDRRAFVTALHLSNMPTLPKGQQALSLIVPVRFELPGKS